MVSTRPQFGDGKDVGNISYGSCFFQIFQRDRIDLPIGFPGFLDADRSTDGVHHCCRDDNLCPDDLLLVERDGVGGEESDAA